MTALGEAAVRYAERGIPIFPCIGKMPVPNGWQHPTLDVEQVRQWWGTMPDANIGMVPMSAGLVALDIDSDQAELVAQRLGAFAEPAPTVATGRRGLPVDHPKHFARAQHRYYRAPADFEFSRLLIDGVLDVRRAGCQNLLPPSIHPESGTRYTWEDKSPAGDIPPPLLAALRAAVMPRRSGTAREPIPDLIREGERDTTLVSIAGALRRRGCSARVIQAALGGVNRDCCRPPLGERDLDRIARSIVRYPPADESRLQKTAAQAARCRQGYVS